MSDLAEDWISRYVAKLANERRLSAHTLSAYSRDLRQFRCYCDAQNLLGWRNVSEHSVRGYVGWRHRQGLSGRSLQRELSSIRGFLDYLLEHGELSHNPARAVRAPKTGRRLPKTLDVDQTARLLSFAADDELSIRDRALFELVYSCGLRLSEVTNLSVNDLDLRELTVQVLGKGRKVRIVPVGRMAADALKQWLGVRATWSNGDDAAVFTTRRGTRMHPRSVQKRLHQWALKQGLDVHVHPHMLRHSFASHVLESSRDLRAVQELLGHADISTTQIYTHLDFQHLAKIYDSAHPRARRKKDS
ncbi:MAG: recombinase XerC [Gammaproteobacteria bacterium SG8_47]|nr:MAG: recombinase XerC [Gammaproteobacteria bacterium SG8_47]